MPDDKTILKLAKDQSCVSCGATDGTVIAAHYQGYRSHSFGKGRSKKPDNIFVAYLCMKCHAKMDNYDSSTFKDSWMRKIDHSEQFMFLILKTLQRLYKQGHIKIK